MSDAITLAITEVRKQLEEKTAELRASPELAELLKLLHALNTLEELAGQEQTSLINVLGLQNSNGIAIRSDEFYELQPLQAAKKYLKKRGEARPLAEIIEGIRKGGGRVDSEDELRMSLSRSTYEIAKVGHDLYGLVEFYPHVRRGAKRKKDDVEVDVERTEEVEKNETTGE